MKVVHRLLLVGAEPAQRSDVAALRAAGFEVTPCGTGREALAALRGGHRDLLVVAAPLPDLPASSLVREAAALQQDLAVLALGAAGDIDPAAAGPATVVEALDRPRPGELLASVRRVLERRALRIENARLGAELADAARQLDAVRAEFDRFAGRLAHDLQAVLQVTEGFATSLARTATGKLDPRERHYLERIVATSSRGNRLVHEVLAFARVGVQAVEQRPVALGDVLQRAQRSLQAQAEGREIAWTVGELPVVRGDASLLQQLFVHLLSNSLQYTRERADAAIRVECMAVADGHEIRVADNGIGFDPQAADRLFQPFGRLHGTSGNGMGLAHARRIVERHGGTMRAEGAPGQGALFAFTLPAHRSHEPAAPPPPAAPPRRPLRVLLVDDDPMVLLSLANMVEVDGHHVDSAAGGQAALDTFEAALAQGRAYDAVITDLGMPHMDGREVARRIKQASGATRVILLTGWGSSAPAVDEARGEADAVLAKPPRLAQLREALNQARPA